MESNFSVSFINVGSADCTLIKCGDKSVLIDGGTNLVTDKITAYLKRSSVTHLDAVIVSHPDSDHIGSLPDVIDEFGTDVVYFGKYSDKELKCDVLKVAHHGSKYSSSEDFLAKASPETAVISVSADDTALPDYYITALLNSVCKNVYRTDSDKTVMITVENGEICTKTHA